MTFIEQSPVLHALNRRCAVRISFQLLLWATVFCINLKSILCIVLLIESVSLCLSKICNLCTCFINRVWHIMASNVATISWQVKRTCSQICDTCIVTGKIILTMSILEVIVCKVVLYAIIICTLWLSPAITLCKIILVEVISNATILEVCIISHRQVIAVLHACVSCCLCILNHRNGIISVHAIYEWIEYMLSIVLCKTFCEWLAQHTEVIYTTGYALQECRSILVGYTNSVRKVDCMSTSVKDTLEVHTWTMVVLRWECYIILHEELHILTACWHCILLCTNLRFRNILVLVITSYTINELIERYHILFVSDINSWTSKWRYIYLLWIFSIPCSLLVIWHCRVASCDLLLHVCIIILSSLCSCSSLREVQVQLTICSMGIHTVEVVYEQGVALCHADREDLTLKSIELYTILYAIAVHEVVNRNVKIVVCLIIDSTLEYTWLNSTTSSVWVIACGCAFLSCCCWNPLRVVSKFPLTSFLVIFTHTDTPICSDRTHRLISGLSNIFSSQTNHLTWQSTVIDRDVTTNLRTLYIVYRQIECIGVVAESFQIYVCYRSRSRISIAIIISQCILAISVNSYRFNRSEVFKTCTHTPLMPQLSHVNQSILMCIIIEIIIMSITRHIKSSVICNTILKTNMIITHIDRCDTCLTGNSFTILIQCWNSKHDSWPTCLWEMSLIVSLCCVINSIYELKCYDWLICKKFTRHHCRIKHIACTLQVTMYRNRSWSLCRCFPIDDCCIIEGTQTKLIVRVVPTLIESCVTISFCALCHRCRIYTCSLIVTVYVTLVILIIRCVSTYVLTTPTYAVQSDFLSCLCTLHDWKEVSVITIELQRYSSWVRCITRDMYVIEVVEALDVPVVSMLSSLALAKSLIIPLHITIIQDVTSSLIMWEHEVTRCHEEVWLTNALRACCIVCCTVMDVICIDISTTLIQTWAHEVNLGNADDRTIEHWVNLCSNIRSTIYDLAYSLTGNVLDLQGISGRYTNHILGSTVITLLELTLLYLIRIILFKIEPINIILFLLLISSIISYSYSILIVMPLVRERSICIDTSYIENVVRETKEVTCCLFTLERITIIHR